nr:hypothetical protein [Candidatus Sigynarchaeota archaeon]
MTGFIPMVKRFAPRKYPDQQEYWLLIISEAKSVPASHIAICVRNIHDTILRPFSFYVD